MVTFRRLPDEEWWYFLICCIIFRRNPHGCGFRLDTAWMPIRAVFVWLIIFSWQHIRKFPFEVKAVRGMLSSIFLSIKFWGWTVTKLMQKNLKKWCKKTWKSCWQILFIVIIYTSRLKNGRRKIKKFVEFLRNLKKVVDRMIQTWYSIRVAVKKERQRRMKQWTLKTKQYKPNPEKFKWIFRWFKSSLRIVWCESDISKQQ